MAATSRIYKLGLIPSLLVICWSPYLWGDLSEQSLSEPRQGRGPVSSQSGDIQQHAVPKSPAYNDMLEPPDDPCLPPLYKDWQEFSTFSGPKSSKYESALRIVIDRTMFILTLEEIGFQDKPRIVYQTEVALGNLTSPTPEGSFIINHIYCYPDVMYFSPVHKKVPKLYNGFFAPLLWCDQAGKCERFNDLGIHGFCPEARPDPAIRPEAFGAVSGGCIRLPDPCAFKKHLIMRSNLGPRRINERGSYHWLEKPINVLIVNGYPFPETPDTIFKVLTDGLERLGNGLGELLKQFGR